MDETIAAARAFNRFYTRQIGILPQGYLDSPFSLAQVRVLYELAHRERATAGELTRELGLDPAYLSRILRGFHRQGLVGRRRSAADARQTDIWLTDAGRTAFAPLDRRSHDDIGALLGDLSESDQRRL